MSVGASELQNLLDEIKDSLEMWRDVVERDTNKMAHYTRSLIKRIEDYSSEPTFTKAEVDTMLENAASEFLKLGYTSHGDVMEIIKNIAVRIESKKKAFAERNPTFANLHVALNAYDDAYDTVISEGGSQLSRFALLLNARNSFQGHDKD
jgi:hypothetical protein